MTQLSVAEPLLGEVGADATADKRGQGRQLQKQSQQKQLRPQVMIPWMQQKKMVLHLYSWDMVLPILQR